MKLIGFDKQIIVFGAGSGGQKVLDSLESMGYEVAAFSDNSVQKWGTMFSGKEVLAPEMILERYPEGIIVVASMFQEEITEQLLRIGLKKSSLRLAEELILEKIDNNMTELGKGLALESRQSVIYIEAVQGFGLGGIEQWTRMAADGLLKNNMPVRILTRQGGLGKEDELSAICTFYNFEENNYKESVAELIQEIASHLPCTVLLNRINQVYLAAHVVKHFFPEKVRLICVMHNDFDRFYMHCKLADKDISAFLCVSSRIQRKMKQFYHITADAVFRASPILPAEDFKKEKSIGGTEPLHIGYAARIEKGQKRCELLLPLLREMDRRKISYVLEIAGDGSFYTQLETLVAEGGHESRVKLLGRLNTEEMKAFWKRQDIYINVSDMEGCALTMLEAMSYAAVPVVTRVSGTEDFIDDGENGYLVEREDVVKMAEYIEYLSKDREKLHTAGQECRRRIKEKCNRERYIEFLQKLLMGQSVYAKGRNR